MQKKSLAYFLIFALIAPLAGAFSWLHYERRCARKEVRHRLMAGLPADQYVHFRFSKETADKLRWEDAREFSLNGQLYDVAKRIESRDSVQLWCIADHKESGIKKRLDALALNLLSQDSGQQRNTQQVLDFFKTMSAFLPPCCAAVKEPAALKTAPLLVLPADSLYQFNPACPPGPPPRQTVAQE